MNPLVTKMAKRFVAGENQDQAIEVVRKLNTSKVMATLDLLGENVSTAEEAVAFTDAYCKLIRGIHDAQVDSNVSLKLTMFGLDISKDLCMENMHRIMETARDCGKMFVRIDMEGSPYTDITLDTFFALHKTYDHVGIVLQAYLRRTMADIKAVEAVNGRVRLCKGAYKEDASIAFKKTPEIRENYLACAEALLKGTSYHGIATHDSSLIKGVLDLAEKLKKPKDSYEFQMLFGMRKSTWFKMAEQGHPFRVYVPFGTHWLPYFIRRLKERKENVFFVLGNLFTR